MSNNAWSWTGLEALKAALRQLPAVLRAEGGHRVTAHANRAALAVRSKYHQRTGELVEHVGVDLEPGEFGFTAIVRSRSPLAFIYEEGTKPRRTRRGANRGRSPKHPIFISEMMRERALMYDDLRGLLREQGLTVIG